MPQRTEFITIALPPHLFSTACKSELLSEIKIMLENGIIVDCDSIIDYSELNPTIRPISNSP